MTKVYNRKVSKQARHKWLRTLPLDQMDAAEISGKLGTGYNFLSYRQFWFPDWDVCKPGWTEEDGTPMQFDIILSDQVWEHLDYPWRATRNVYSMLREGGWFYLCVPFYLKYHGAPYD